MTYEELVTIGLFGTGRISRRKTNCQCAPPPPESFQDLDIFECECGKKLVLVSSREVYAPAPLKRWVRA